MTRRAVLDNLRFLVGATAIQGTPFGQVRAGAKGQANGKQLFIDRRQVEGLDGIEQVLHSPVKHPGPVVAPERPWERDSPNTRTEGSLHIWSSPIWLRDRECWRMWYFGGCGMLPLYAESSDGLNWVKPALGLAVWNGSSANNIVALGVRTGGWKGNRLVLVEDPLDPNRWGRFKALTLAGSRLMPLASADGLRWRRIQAAGPASGDEYRLHYDAPNRRFVATVKLSSRLSPGERPRPEMGRRVAISVSTDFRRWSEPEAVFQADEEDVRTGAKLVKEALEDPERRKPLVVNADDFSTDVYNMPVFEYEGMYLGLPVIFHKSGRYEHSFGSNQDGIQYPVLAVSRDLRSWERPGRKPFLPLSRISDPKNWDHGMIHMTPPVRKGGELWFYYTGTRFTHHQWHQLKPEYYRRAEVKPADLASQPSSAVFVARLRLDGFASLHAGERGGLVRTKPLKVTGPKLLVNADAAGGELRAELLDAATGEAIPGYSFAEGPEGGAIPFAEDSVAATVRWTKRSGVAELAGREVRVGFALRNAHLYSFWFGD